MKGIYKGYYNIVQDKPLRESTIYIYGVIGGFDFEKWKPINTADKFVEDFQKIENESDVIHVKINSPGGNIWDGLPIYNTLKNSEKEIRTYVDGIAYSMASLIALAGDTVYGYSNSMLMFHNGSSYSYGNAKKMRESATTLDQYDEALGSIIEEKLNISPEEVKEKYLNYSDNYFVGKKAKKLGFFDEIITTKKAKIPKDIKEMSPKDLLKFYGKMNYETKEVSNITNTKPKINMNKLTKVKGVLNQEADFEQNAEGIYLSSEQLDAIEASLATYETDVNTANQATTAADVRTAAAEGNVQIVQEAVTSALTEAEVENAADLDTVEGIQALSALIKEYGQGDGAELTATKLQADADADASNLNLVGNIDISKEMNN